MELQPTILSIVIITTAIAAFLFYVNRKLVKFDPLSKPTGVVLLVMMATEMIEGMVKDKTNDEISNFLTPYIMSIITYIFISNIAGLFSLETPTSNYSVTLVLAALTCILIEVFSSRARGAKGYIKSWF